MQAGFPIQTLLPLVVAAMMLAVGMSLRMADIVALRSARAAAAIGLANMYLIFPALAFLIAASFPLSPMLQVGLVLLAASPSASTSTLFTHLARGDTALALALTSVSKVLPVFIIPLYVGLAAAWFTDTETEVALSFADTSERLLQIVLLPVIAGMALRRSFPAMTAKAGPWVTRLSVLALIVLIAAVVYRERYALPGMLLSSGPAALALCLLGMACAYGSARIARLPSTQRSALTIEVGMQSGGTSIAIAAGVLASPAMAVPAAVYSLIMYAAAGLFVAWQRGVRERSGAAAAVRSDSGSV